ncbi:MAG: DNA translocase FtsK [Opitutaceae bacterium]|nr:DNA translocase FtsK [Opitutaceae bacterium]
MAKSASSNSNNVPSFQAPRYQPHWAVFSLCLLFGLLLSVAFIDFTPLQSAMATTHPTAKNLVGRFGAEFSWWAFHVIGISAWLLPVFLLWMAYVAIRNARRLASTRILAMLLCMVSASGLAAMFEGYDKTDYFSEGLGGLVGTLIYQSLLKDTLGVFGTGLLLVMIYAIGLMFIFTKDIAAEFEKFTHGFSAWRESRAKLRTERAEIKRMAKEAMSRPKTAPVIVGPPASKKLSIASRGTNPPMGTRTPFATDEKPEGFVDNTSKKPASSTAAPYPEPAARPAALPAPATVKTGKGSVSPFTDQAPLATDTKALAVNAGGRIELNIVKPEEPKKAAKATVPQSLDENYQRPPFTLLREPVKSHASNSEDEHRRNAENLLRILSEFGVEVTLGEIHAGPVITCYEVVPAAGVRVEKIAGLDKNIALGMRAQSVRILAPIPGKAAVGVEVPNQNSTPVGMRELLESEDWADAVARTELPIALGKDVSGKVLISDLTKMPHLLIAGATGSGKSVCINSIIASIVYRKSPRDLRLIMVDPKVVELKIFNTLPHMLIPVVTEPKKVPAALKWLLGEMEQRYQIFAKVGVRNIAGFNTRKKSSADLPPDAQHSLEGVDPLAADDGLEVPDKLPYIVAIIDELADLMMVAPAEIETSIARLAQLARAAGIHLIIATQRPSVNVITGVIKANLPSRIAFQVASQVDSRTILDGKGADTLIGRGDMLFSPPGSSRLVRAQGAFVSDEEVHEFVEFLKKNGPPQYASSVQQQIDRDASAGDDDEESGGDDDLGDDEELYNQALDVIKSTKRASTSMIQRRLRIGYNRAARIMDLMEQKGIVGPENGSSPREILVDLDSL